MPQKRKRPTSKKAQNTKSAPTRRGASSVVHVAPSMSGKLRVVSDDRAIEQKETHQVTVVAQDQAIPVQQATTNRSFGFDGMFNPDDVEDEGASESTQKAESDSPFASQDASAFSRSSDTYSAHKKHEVSNPSSRDKKPHNWSTTHIVMIVVAALLVAALAVGGLFFWDRYLRYDDAADFQGTWYFQEGAVEVTVDEAHIHLPEDLHYAYTLDTWAKTISLSFADLTGGGSYEFSDDRSSIVIREGEGSDVTSLTLVKAPESLGEGTVPDASLDGGAAASGSDGSDVSGSSDSNAKTSESTGNA